MRRMVIAILTILLLFAMCGCKKSVTMNINMTCFGDGLEGTEKISGGREYLIEDVREGDFIYEISSGELSKEPPQGYKHPNWFIKIERIEKDSISIIADTGDVGTHHKDKFQGKKFTLYSPNYAMGELHYIYEITFT